MIYIYPSARARVKTAAKTLLRRMVLAPVCVFVMDTRNQLAKLTVASVRTSKSLKSNIVTIKKYYVPFNLSESRPSQHIIQYFLELEMVIMRRDIESNSLTANITLQEKVKLWSKNWITRDKRVGNLKQIYLDLSKG